MSGGSYNNNMTGALFKNEKGENEKRPDYRGLCEIAGFEYTISAWLNKSSNGATYMKLKFEPKAGRGADRNYAQRPPRTPSQPQRAVPDDVDVDFDDPIPF